MSSQATKHELIRKLALLRVASILSGDDIFRRVRDSLGLTAYRLEPEHDQVIKDAIASVIPGVSKLVNNPPQPGGDDAPKT